MGRKGRRLRKAQRSKHTNRHHLIWQRVHYGDGYGFLLRQAFVYELDVDIHNYLHQHILHDIPKPPEWQLKMAWEAYRADKWLIDQYDIVQACEWLAKACSDPAWRACMNRQVVYLKDALKDY
jgi:hypothetical protein